MFTENDDDKYQQWMEKVNDFLESGKTFCCCTSHSGSKKLVEVLDKMTVALVDLGLDGEADFGGDMDDDPFGAHNAPEEKSKPKVEI